MLICCQLYQDRFTEEVVGIEDFFLIGIKYFFLMYVVIVLIIKGTRGASLVESGFFFLKFCSGVRVCLLIRTLSHKEQCIRDLI